MSDLDATTGIERLYKYGRVGEHSESLFSGSSVWLAAASAMNDPFECSPVFSFTHDRDEIMAQLVRAIRARDPARTHDSATAEAASVYLRGKHRDPATWEAVGRDLLREFRHGAGLYCLSERNDSILMWSHYAADHAGYCLEFEATDYTPVFGTAQRVAYCDDYPSIDFYGAGDKFELAFLTKYSDWAYEKEWRIIVPGWASRHLEYPARLLKSVTFGIRMPDSAKADIRRWLGRRERPVKLFQAVQDGKRFCISFDEIPWVPA